MGKKTHEALDKYLGTNVYDFMTQPGTEHFSPETLAYIEREARKSKLLAALRGAAVKGGSTLASIPGELATPSGLTYSALTGGMFIPVYAIHRLLAGTIGGAADYYNSRSHYRDLYNYLNQPSDEELDALEKEMEEEDDKLSKKASKINYGGILARRVAREGKHSSGYDVQILPSSVDDPYIKGTFTGKLRDDDYKAQLYKRILEKMEESNPEELRDVVVHLGGTRNLSDALRTVTNRNIGIFSRIGNTLRLPVRIMASTMANNDRADHYDPDSNAVTLYGDNPAVLTHELGHAIDYNRYKGWGRFKKGWLYAINALKDEAAANKASEEAIVKAFKDNPKVLSALQTLRVRTLPRGFYTYNTEVDPYGYQSNKYDDKSLKEILSAGKIGHRYIMDEHVNLPTKDLIEILRNELLDSEQRNSGLD